MTDLLAVRAPVRPETFNVHSIDLYITSTCNRRCTFCFLSDEFLNSRSLMSAEASAEIVDWAARGGIDEITVLGGEPATHPEFATILQHAKRSGRTVRTVTNGSRRFRESLGRPEVSDALDRVAVSIDAPAAADMDRLRGRGAFADAMATVDLLRTLGIPFDINCTVVRSCLESFHEMPGFAERLGADRLNVHWFSAVGRGRVHAADETITPVEWHKLVLGEVQRYRSPRPSYVVDCELGYSYDLPGEKPGSCAVQDLENLQFFPSGAVFACGLLVEDDALSGYEWRAGELHRRGGDTEVTRTQGCSGCPFRSDVDGQRALCIYNRLLT
jgi:MoaA/NifB/PqqE/SkfB family radical SAM enzyme